MDYLMPDDATMEIMRQEFDRLKTCDSACAYALSDTQPSPSDGGGTYISTALLFLYFIIRLSYNIGYGTAIFNSDRSMGRLHSLPNEFRNLNNLR